MWQIYSSYQLPGGKVEQRKQTQIQVAATWWNILSQKLAIYKDSDSHNRYEPEVSLWWHVWH